MSPNKYIEKNDFKEFDTRYEGLEEKKISNKNKKMKTLLSKNVRGVEKGS